MGRQWATACLHALSRLKDHPHGKCTRRLGWSGVPCADALVKFPRLLTKYALLVVSMLVLSLAFVNPGLVAAAHPETTVLGYTFQFEGKTYDPVRDESTWHYSVRGSLSDGVGYMDLIWWSFTFCAPSVVHNVNDVSAGGFVQTSKHDQGTSSGIRWEQVVAKTSAVSFSFVLQGDWDVGLSLTVRAGDGHTAAVGTLPGPACQADACRVDYDITTRTDWRFMGRGEYAARAWQIRLSGNAAVRLKFNDFQDVRQLNDGGVSAPIRFEYSIGSTLDEAEAFGWHSAAAFNDMEVIVKQDDVAATARVDVWARVFITEAHRSSDYFGSGRIAVIPSCL